MAIFHLQEDGPPSRENIALGDIVKTKDALLKEGIDYTFVDDEQENLIRLHSPAHTVSRDASLYASFKANREKGVAIPTLPAAKRISEKAKLPDGSSPPRSDGPLTISPSLKAC